MTNIDENEIRNTCLILEHKTWMTTLIDKIGSLLHSISDNSDLSNLIDNFKTETYTVMQAKLFFTILDGLKTLVNSPSFQMGSIKICIIPYSFHSMDLTITPSTKTITEIGENSSVLVIKPTTNFVVPPFQSVMKD